MSIRIHRSIKIAKGVRLNISKSGIGASIGPRGAKISVGPNGIYSNFSLIGTGISSRKKISGNNHNKPKFSNSLNTNLSTHSITVNISIDDNSGKETITLIENGKEINNESLLRKLKKTIEYKSKLEEVRNKTLNKVNQESDLLLDIHKLCEKTPNWNLISKQVNESTPKKYAPKPFLEKEIDKNSYLSEIEAEAKRNIKGIFGIKKKRANYIKTHLEERYLLEYSNWEKRKKDFEKKERLKEIAENKIYQQEYDAWVLEMENLLNPDTKYIENRLEELFSNIQLPIDFSISFDVKNNGETILLDIDLPEIEDYPNKKAKRLTSGKISIKEKTLKEKKKDYFSSIASIGIYFSSLAFSSAPTIKEVIASSYTQRINKATGNLEDQYVYSVNFNKTDFCKLNFDKIYPIETLQYFDHRINFTKTYELKPIIPFE